MPGTGWWRLGCSERERRGGKVGEGGEEGERGERKEGAEKEERAELSGVELSSLSISCMP